MDNTDSASMDYIVCGACKRSFHLNNMQGFLKHKKFDCEDPGNATDPKSKSLVCLSCRQKFDTPWSLLKHAQNVHFLQIYLEQALGGGFQPVHLSEDQSANNAYPSLPGLDPGLGQLPSGQTVQQWIQGIEQEMDRVEETARQSKQSAGKSEVQMRATLDSLVGSDSPIPGGKSGAGHVQASQSVVGSSDEVVDTTTLDNCLPSISVMTRNVSAAQSFGKLISQLEKQTADSSVEQINNNNNDGNGSSSSTSSSGEDDSQGELPEKQPEPSFCEKNCCSIFGCQAASNKNGICCNDQNCGVTVIPGTHESLKTCCNAVLPKKRKRHMETSHTIGHDHSHHKNSADNMFSDLLTSTETDSPISLDDDVDNIMAASKDLNIFPTVNSGNVGTASMPIMTFSNSTMSNTSNAVTISSKLAQAFPNPTIPQAQNRQPTNIGIPQKFISAAPEAKSADLDRIPDDITTSLFESLGLNTENNQVAPPVTISSKLQPFSQVVLVSSSSSPPPKLPEPAPPNPQASAANFDLDEIEEVPASRALLGALQPHMNSAMMAKAKKRTYPTSRPFKCDQCDQAFNQRIHLRKHQSKHTGIKPYKCDKCDYATVERSHLKVHMRVHTGEKPFKCPHCDYATAQNSTLKIHMNRHHERRHHRNSSSGSHGNRILSPINNSLGGATPPDEDIVAMLSENQPSIEMAAV